MNSAVVKLEHRRTISWLTNSVIILTDDTVLCPQEKYLGSWLPFAGYSWPTFREEFFSRLNICLCCQRFGASANDWLVILFSTVTGVSKQNDTLGLEILNRNLSFADHSTLRTQQQQLLPSASIITSSAVRSWNPCRGQPLANAIKSDIKTYSSYWHL